jgi:hypothetical protein
MNYPIRRRKLKKKAPDADRGDDGSELKLAEYSAPFGEERPWRIATDVPQLVDTWRTLRPERGRLH